MKSLLIYALGCLLARASVVKSDGRVQFGVIARIRIMCQRPLAFDLAIDRHVAIDEPLAVPVLEHGHRSPDRLAAGRDDDIDFADVWQVVFVTQTDRSA